MSNFIGMISNEQMKTWRKVSSWVMVGLMLSVLVLGAVIVKWIAAEEQHDDDWRTNVQAQVEASEERWEGIPESISRVMQQEADVGNYRLEHDIPPIETATLWGFMDVMSQTTMLITLFTLIIASSSVASEFSWGTIKLLLIRPISRSKILLAKYVSTFISAIIFLLILFAGSFVVGSLFFGWDMINVPYLAYTNGEVIERSMVTHIFANYGLDSVNLLMMVTFAFMISTVFRSSALAIGLSVFLMFAGTQFVFILAQFNQDWVKYILFANTDLRQYLDGSPLLEGMTLPFSLAILGIYFIVFNALSWWVFTKRDVSA